MARKTRTQKKRRRTEKKARADRSLQRVFALLNAISDLHHNDLLPVINPSIFNSLKSFAEEITKIAADYHRHEEPEGRARIWEFVLEDIYLAGEAIGEEEDWLHQKTGPNTEHSRRASIGGMNFRR
jgi:hypothetical protein